MVSEEDLNDADADAMKRHHTLGASVGFSLLAESVWTALRGLGVDRGRMYAFGDHAATLTGATDSDTHGVHQKWVAEIPPTGEDNDPTWPHRDLPLRVHSETEARVHDVVFASLPWADLHFRSRDGQLELLALHQEFLSDAVACTLPGGILAAVVSHGVLDNPDSAVRELVFDNADLLGAVRLPATALRPQLSDEDAEPTDLLLLRRRVPHESAQSALFLDVAPMDVPGGVTFVNEYFSMFYPEHVVGLNGAVADPDPTAGSRYTVVDGDAPLDTALHWALSNVVAKARARSLYAVSATWSPIETRAAREAPRPPRRQDSPGAASGGLAGSAPW